MTQELHIELELIQTQMAQKPMLRAGSGNARALRIQIMCGKIQEGDGHWPNSSKKLQKARNLWVLRTLRRTIKRKALRILLLLLVNWTLGTNFIFLRSK